MQIQTIPLADITVREGFNPRSSMDVKNLKDLTHSVKTRGLLQALTVAPDGSGGFVLVDGHRRFRAASDAGLTEVAVIVRDSDREGEQLIDAVVANSQREDMSLLDQAHAASNLATHGYSVKEIAQQLSTTQKTINERLALLEMPQMIQQLISDGQLRPSHMPRIIEARAVSEALALGMAAKIVEHDLRPVDFQRDPLRYLTRSEPTLGVWLAIDGQVRLEDITMTEETRARYKTANQRAGFERHTYLPLDDATLQAAIAGGFAYGPPTDDEAVSHKVAICDGEWLAEQATLHSKAALRDADREVKRRAESQAKSGKVDLKTGYAVAEDGKLRKLKDDELKAARKAERDAINEAREKAYVTNSALGAHVMSQLQGVPLDREVALALVALVLRGDASAVAGRGLALTQARYLRETHNKDGSVRTRKFDAALAAEDVYGYLAAGETGEQVIARLAALLFCAQQADEEATVASDRPQSGWWNSQHYSQPIELLAAVANIDGSTPQRRSGIVKGGHALVDVRAAEVAKRRSQSSPKEANPKES